MVERKLGDRFREHLRHTCNLVAYMYMLREIKTEMYQIQSRATAFRAIVAKTWKSPNTKEKRKAQKSRTTEKIFWKTALNPHENHQLY